MMTQLLIMISYSTKMQHNDYKNMQFGLMRRIIRIHICSTLGRTSHKISFDSFHRKLHLL